MLIHTRRWTLSLPDHNNIVLDLSATTICITIDWSDRRRGCQRIDVFAAACIALWDSLSLSHSVYLSVAISFEQEMQSANVTGICQNDGRESFLFTKLEQRRLIIGWTVAHAENINCNSKWIVRLCVCRCPLRIAPEATQRDKGFNDNERYRTKHTCRAIDEKHRFVYWFLLYGATTTHTCCSLLDRRR